MATIEDQDRFFSGRQSASTPKHLIQEGSIARLINARFVEGAITNALGFDELQITYGGSTERVFASSVTYQKILNQGDVQLVAPLENISGKFLVAVISGILFLIDTESLIAYDITPKSSFLPESSQGNFFLSYLDNDGGIYGSGGYLVIFNYPNRPIFVNQDGARLSVATNYEMPPAKFGATSANRAFVISAQNIMYASDPLGGGSSLAPLTFAETLDPAGSYTGQIFTIGSALDLDDATATCRMPRLLGPAQDFLGHNLLVSTENKKYIVAVGNPRSDWENIDFIAYAGTSDGIAGPLACTNVGSAVVYISSTGRIKTLYQDQDRESSLSETFFDEDLGQYLNQNEVNFYYRPWYRELDHSRSIVKFSRDRVYATVYPYLADAVGKYGDIQNSYTHRALAIGSLASETLIGPQASIAWEGFYDWLNPTSLVVLDHTLYVVSKDKYGRVSYYRENNSKCDDHKSVIYTRGYFSSQPGKSKSLMTVFLFFRRLSGNIKINLYYLVDNTWVLGADCESSNKVIRLNIKKNRCRTNSWSIPIRLEIEHNGCRFELESIRVEGESHKEEKK